MRKAFEQKLIDDANAIGLVILTFGLKEKEPAGFFNRQIATPEVVRRILETHHPFRTTHFAAKDYQKGYQALLDNSDLKACSYNADAKRRFRFIEAKLEVKLLDGLLASYARMARAENEREKRERQEARARSRAARRALNKTTAQTVAEG